jgi:hypothetical protein
LPICLCEPEQVEEFCFALVLWMSVVEQVFGNLSVVESSIPDIWDVSHLASRQPPDVGTCEAYNARKWLCEFDCVMLTVTPGMNDCPNGTLWQQSCPVLKRMCELHNAELRNWLVRHFFFLGASLNIEIYTRIRSAASAVP